MFIPFLMPTAVSRKAVLHSGKGSRTMSKVIMGNSGFYGTRDYQPLSGKGARGSTRHEHETRHERAAEIEPTFRVARVNLNFLKVFQRGGRKQQKHLYS